MGIVLKTTNYKGCYGRATVEIYFSCILKGLASLYAARYLPYNSDRLTRRFTRPGLVYFASHSRRVPPSPS